MLTLYNLLEPPGFIEHFREHAPEGFSTVAIEGGVPAFSTPFDLLTTLDPAVLTRVCALPLSRWWRRLLRPATCFIGTTVSEYSLLPAAIAPEEFVRRLVSEVAPRYPFVIVKDLPTEAILVGDASLTYCQRFVGACIDEGFVLVEGQALAYVPVDFASTDDFVAHMSHVRRKNVRRKLRSRAGLEVDAIPTGDARFTGRSLIGDLYALYRNVYEQSDIHFDLLTEPFFRSVMQDGSYEGVVFLYYASGVLIGWNLCISENGLLIDKYLGLSYPAAREHNLYTVSWFHNLEYALTLGCRYYVAGWTDPEVKRQLGARFTSTLHAVHVRNPIVRTLLKPFKRLFEPDRRWHATHVATTHS